MYNRQKINQIINPAHHNVFKILYSNKSSADKMLNQRPVFEMNVIYNRKSKFCTAFVISSLYSKALQYNQYDQILTSFTSLFYTINQLNIWLSPFSVCSYSHHLIFCQLSLSLSKYKNFRFLTTDFCFFLLISLIQLLSGQFINFFWSVKTHVDYFLCTRLKQILKQKY